LKCLTCALEKGRAEGDSWRRSEKWQLTWIGVSLSVPIWHILIGASLQFASRDRSLFPLALLVCFGGRTKLYMHAPIMIIVFCATTIYTYILVLARLELVFRDRRR
jgi:hypothetical protein